MLRLKFLMRCCCDGPGRNEEEKIENVSRNKTEAKNSTINHSLNNSEGKFHDDNIIAAPFPNHGIDTMAYPKLRLVILESTTISPGTILKISATGLEDSKRNKSDFKTFIGNRLTDNGEIINDFVIPEDSEGMGRQHLLINFNISTSKYYISDLGDGTGTFAKIISELILKNGYIISFGNSHMKIFLGPDNEKLGIKFLEGPKINEEFFFSACDESVLIGRMTDCRIKFEDSNMSRYQCSIRFRQGCGWVLKDGINSKCSTNGTWLYVEEQYEIINKMIFKAGKTLFEANLEASG